MSDSPFKTLKVILSKSIANHSSNLFSEQGTLNTLFDAIFFNYFR